jgi:hypothetical protein
MMNEEQMANLSVHDNIVTGYTVLCNRKELVICTEFRERQTYEKTNIVFRGVEAYFLTGDNMQSILFDVTECTIEHILNQYSSEFISGAEYDWPGPWNESIDSCRRYFFEHQCKGWLINSSYGISGFVVANEMKFKKY